MLAACLFIFSTYAQADRQYTLNTGDTINIVVFEEADLSFEVKVDETGVIAYPYLNDILLSGKTTSEVEKEITEGLLGRVLINPNVEVTVTGYRPFSIGGEVKAPGSYPYQPDLNIRKAINLAGGTTDWASTSKFTVKRADKTIKDGKLTMDSVVYPGDTLTVLPRRF